ncbi:hypothetical protein JCM8097_008723 [Rhodosporidiobolus ruineniae]
MSSDIHLAPSPAACLSEEAMDLICSFVRDFEDDRGASLSCLPCSAFADLILSMSSTLCALSLTSRRWTSSAVRALYFDPTRSLRRRQAVQACWLLTARYLKRPILGTYTCALVRLPYKQQLLVDASENDTAQVETWTLTLLRACPNLSAIAIPLKEVVDWPTELARLDHLRRLIISSLAFGEFWRPLDLVVILRRLAITSLCTLVVEGLQSGLPHPPVEAVEIQVDVLEISQYLFHLQPHLALRPVGLKHLRLKPFFCSDGIGENLFLPTLETLEYLPVGRPQPTPATPYSASAAFPFIPLPDLPSLRQLAVESVRISLGLLDRVSRQYPQLVTLSFKDSVWPPEQWAGDLSPISNPAVVLNLVLKNLPSLSRLDLGRVPVRTRDALWALQQLCTDRGIRLDFYPALARCVNTQSRPPRPRLTRSTSTSSDEDNFSNRDSGEDDGSASESDDDSASAYLSVRHPLPFLPPTFFPPIGVPSSSSGSSGDPQDVRDDDDAFFEFSDRVYLVPPPAPRDLDPLSSHAFPSSTTVSASPTPSRSPSPVFLFATPDQPRFEPHYQALDFGEKSQDDFDSGDGEEWRRWEGMDTVDEADLAWREGEGTTYAPIEELSREEFEVEVDAEDELDEPDEEAVEATIEVWRTVEVCAA